jgi:hypothetical protein
MSEDRIGGIGGIIGDGGTERTGRGGWMEKSIVEERNIEDVRDVNDKAGGNGAEERWR